MADHLPLPPGRLLATKRQPNFRPARSRGSDRSEHAAELKGLLDAANERADLADVDDEELDPRLVLKILAGTRITEGPFGRLKFEVLGEGKGWTYAVLTNRESRRVFEQILREYAAAYQGDIEWSHPQNLASAIDNIVGIELYGPEDRLDPELDVLTFDEPEVVDISLWPSATSGAAQERVDAIAALLDEPQLSGFGDRVVAIDNRPHTTMVRARVDRATLTTLSRDGWVERIRPEISTRTTLRDILRASAPDVLPPATGEAVGVLDGVVVEANPLLTGRVPAARSFPHGHVYAGMDTHGTAVASLAMWGSLDFVVRAEVRTQHAVPVISGRVLDVDRRSGRYVVAGQAHVTIEDAIKWMKDEHDVKIVNISINRDGPEVGLLRSELTAKLDELSRELGLVVIVSAGNRDNAPTTGWLHGYPEYLLETENEVTPPGDAALAVTVGAISGRDIPGTDPQSMMLPVAPRGAPAPFTRTGPVRNHLQYGRAKPEFSADGGNVVLNTATHQVIREDSGVSVPVATPPVGGQILSIEAGTSFAAPAVAYEFALLASRYPHASANTLRALAALSARRSEPSRLATFDTFRASVYGVPDAARVLESGGSKAILTIEEEMSTNSVVVHELPVPYEFAEGTSRRSLRIALAFDPPVLRSRREYIAGSMTVELVRGLTFDEVADHYQRQPTVAQADADPTLLRRRLPPRSLRPWLAPGPQKLASSTLVRHDYVDQPWDPDLDSYFLIVTHQRSSWSPRQQRSYAAQGYSLAVELSDQGRPSLDVHGLVAASLRTTTRASATRVRLTGGSR